MIYRFDEDWNGSFFSLLSSSRFLLPSSLSLSRRSFHSVSNFSQSLRDCTGEILAEQIDWSRTQTRYRGLHFPETDIPCQARELYAVSPLRLLADVSFTYFLSVPFLCSLGKEIEVVADDDDYSFF